MALGNNDSDYGDYKLDTQGAYLQTAGKILADTALPDQKEKVIRQFSNGGYYTIKHAFPLVNTRIIVLNDVLLSPRFTDCASSADAAAGAAEIDWLNGQLHEAETQRERCRKPAGMAFEAMVEIYCSLTHMTVDDFTTCACGTN